jgi:hypothetical protein
VIKSSEGDLALISQVATILFVEVFECLSTNIIQLLICDSAAALEFRFPMM